MITSLLLYAHPYTVNAPTIMEHVNAFVRYSSARFTIVNTEFGFPSALRSHNFDEIVLHYSLFGNFPFRLDPEFTEFVRSAPVCRKVAFFQDEHQNCKARFAVIDELGIDTIYSLLEPRYFDQVYRAHTRVQQIHQTLTGYVDDQLVALARRISTPVAERKIDVGYRARPLAYWTGRGAQEKTEVADRFTTRASKEGLRLDIEWRDSARIYGDAWYKFLASCRSVLGVEAGVSIFDLDGEVRIKVEHLLESEPNLSFEEVHSRLLEPYENRIHYRTISPRVFEAAALRVAQILYVGDYQGILKPDVHYIPLQKDFSNIDVVLERLRDDRFISALTARAYDDLIASGRYGYSQFISDFDSERPQSVGGSTNSKAAGARLASAIMARRFAVARRHALAPLIHSRPVRWIAARDWPGRALVRSIYRRII